jgi:hypothetical protein
MCRADHLPKDYDNGDDKNNNNNKYPPYIISKKEAERCS